MSNAKEISNKVLVFAYRKFVGLFGSFVDHKFLDPHVPISKLVGHSNYLQYLTDIGNLKGMKILEIGSREVTSRSDARKRFSNAEYVGFDYYPGPVAGLYCHSEFLGRKIRDVAQFDWCDVDLEEVVGGTKYPLP